MTSAEGFTKFKIDYDLHGKDPHEIERLIQHAVDEVIAAANISPNAVKILPPIAQTRWELTLETAPDSPTPTCPVVLAVCGVKADDDLITLSTPKSDGPPFQPGKKDVFEVPVNKEIGDIFKLRFGFPKDVAQAAWILKSVQLHHPRNRDIFKTECNLTLKKSPKDDPWHEIFVVWPDYPLLPLVPYNVAIHTSPKSGPMDSEVDILIFGDYGNSGRRSLKTPKSGPKFQPGQVDEFTVPIVKLGAVRKVRIINTLSGQQTTWMLEKVVIKESPTSEEEWEFKCGRYFAPNKGDGKCDRFVEPGEEPEEKPPPPPEPVPPPPPPPAEPEPVPMDMPPEQPPAEPKPQSPKAEKKKKKDDMAKLIWTIWWENREEQAQQQSVPLSFFVLGEKGTSEEITLEMDLKPGESDRRKIRIDPDQIGPIVKVRFDFAEKAPKGLKWDIAKLHLKHLVTDEIHTFEFPRPLVKKETDSTMEGSDRGVHLCTYQIELHTADRTALFDDDLQAKILVRGSNGETGERTVVNAPVEGKVKIKQGDVLKFDVESVDIGEINGVVLTHNKTDKKTGDFVQKIVVRPSHKQSEEYIVTFSTDKPTPDNLWQLWWENRQSQAQYNDVDLLFVVVGEKECTQDFNVKSGLKAGESDKQVIKFDVKKIGTIDKVRFRFADGVQLKTQWDIAKLHLMNFKTAEMHSWEFERPAVKKETDSTVEASDRGVPISIYEVELHTTDRKELFTDDVKAKLLVKGAKGETGERTAVNAPVEGKLKIKQGDVLKFEIEGVDIGEIKGVNFIHNKDGKKPGDFVQKIVVRPTHQRSSEYVVTFDSDVPDNVWHMWWENRETQEAIDGVDLIFVVVGEKECSQDFNFKAPLKSGESKKLMIKFDAKKIGTIDKVRFRFGDNVKLKTKWEIAKLHLLHVKSSEKHTFEFDRPAVKKETDSTVEATDRGIPISIYEVELHTVDRKGLFADDVKAKLLIKGAKGETGERTAVNAPVEGKLKIKQGEVLKFDIEGVDIGEIKGVVFTHNKEGKKTGDFVQKIVVRPSHQRSSEFIVTFESDAPDNVWHMWWENRETQEVFDAVDLTFIVVGEKECSQEFNFKAPLKPGDSKKLVLKFDGQKIGAIDKVRFRFADNVKLKTKWEIAKLHLLHVKSAEQHTFEFQRPAVKKENDSTFEASDRGVPISIYEVELHTADRKELFTDDVKAKLLVKGANGETGERTAVNAPVEGKLKIKQGEILKFEIEGVDIGEIKGVVFTHNKEGKKTGAFVQKIVIRPTHQRTAEYVVTFDSDTPDNVWHMWWENRDKQKPLENIALTFIVVGQKECSQDFNFKAPLNPGESKKLVLKFDGQQLGAIDKVRFRFADGVKLKTKWEISKLHLLHVKSAEQHTFEFERPFVKKETDSTFEATDRGIPISIYEVELHTANREGLFAADVNAKLLIKGSTGETGERTAVNAAAEGKLKIKQGEVLKFEIEGVDIGEIKAVVFKHNKEGKKTADFVQKIVVRSTRERSNEYIITFDEDFPDNVWSIWWESRETQIAYKDVDLAFVVVGEKDITEDFSFRVALQPGESEKRLVKFSAAKIGAIDKVRIKFADGVKLKTKWDIAKLHLLHMKSSEQHTFEFEKPAIKKETDSTVEASIRGDPITIHAVELYTGERKGMFTGDVVTKVIIRGVKGDTGKRTAYNSTEETSQPKPKQGDAIKFEVEGVDIGDVKAVQFIHNKPNKTAADFLEKIVIRPLHRPGVEFVFQYSKPKPPPQGPTVTVEQEPASEGADPREWIMTWTNFADQPIDAIQISLILFGEKGETTPVLLDVELAPGDSKEHKLVVAEDIGELKRLRFGHGPQTTGEHPWKVHEVRLKHVSTGMLHRFTMGEPPKPPSASPKYRIEVYTRRSATDVGARASIYVKLKGQSMVSDKCWLNKSLNNVIRFQPGQMDVFEVDNVADVGEVINITFGGPDERVVSALRSYITKVVVVPLHWRIRKEFVFNFNNTTPAPSAIAAIAKRTWMVKVKTGNFPMSTTQTPLCLAVCGKHRTGEVVSFKQANGFVPNQMYQFKTEMEDIDEVFKVRLGFNDWSKTPTLFVEELYLEVLNGPQYAIAVGEWIWASAKQDSWREFLVKKTKLQLKVYRYQLAVWTGKTGGVGGTAYVEIFGSKGDTGKRRLANSKSHTKQFAANQLDLFDIEAVDIGDCRKLILTFKPKDSSDKWQVTKMLLQMHPLGGDEYSFDCNNTTLDSSNASVTFPVAVRNPAKPNETAAAEDYLVFVSTGPAPEMATRATVSVSIFGDRGPAPPTSLVRQGPSLTASGKPLAGSHTFQNGAVDSFPISIPLQHIGTITKVRIEHNNVGMQTNWFLDKFTIQSLSKPRELTQHFEVNRWLSAVQDDGDVVRECPASYFDKPATVAQRYEITLSLGPKTTAKIPANVLFYVVLCGKTPYNSGRRGLRKPVNGTPFLQPNAESTFSISAVGIGEVTKVVLGHDSSDPEIQLDVSSAAVTWEIPTKGRVDFPVNKLLVKPHPNKDAELVITNGAPSAKPPANPPATAKPS